MVLSLTICIAKCYKCNFLNSQNHCVLMHKRMVKLLLSSVIPFLGAVHLWRTSIGFEASQEKTSGSNQRFQRNCEVMCLVDELKVPEAYWSTAHVQ